MKKSTIITIIAFALGIVILAAGFILLTDNNISKQIFTTTTTTTAQGGGETEPAPTYEPMNFFKEDVSKYITLGQYKEIQLEVDQLEVSNELVDLQIKILLVQEQETTKIREGKITDGTIFNFDYTGYLVNDDGSLGEAFERGAATDQIECVYGTDLITITGTEVSGFVDGFAQGVLGHKVGETFKVNITFPEDYTINPSMAGKKTVFEVKINYILQPNFTDGWVKEYSSGECTTTSQFFNDMKAELNATNEENNNQLLWNYIVNAATVIEIPQQQFDYLYNSFCEKVNYYVQMYSMYYGATYSFDEMLTMFGFNNIDELKEYTIEYIKSDLVIYAIVQAEAFEVSDEEYNSVVSELMEANEMTAEEVIEYYGGEEAIKESLLLQMASEMILEENTFVQKK